MRKLVIILLLATSQFAHAKKVDLPVPLGMFLANPRIQSAIDSVFIPEPDLIPTFDSAQIEQYVSSQTEKLYQICLTLVVTRGQNSRVE
jgi:hypothetical protein